MIVRVRAHAYMSIRMILFCFCRTRHSGKAHHDFLLHNVRPPLLVVVSGVSSQRSNLYAKLFALVYTFAHTYIFHFILCASRAQLQRWKNKSDLYLRYILLRRRRQRTRIFTVYTLLNLFRNWTFYLFIYFARIPSFTDG